MHIAMKQIAISVKESGDLFDSRAPDTYICTRVPKAEVVRSTPAIFTSGIWPLSCPFIETVMVAWSDDLQSCCPILNLYWVELIY